MSTELKACPFCGSTNLSTDSYSVQPDNFHSAYVECDDCEARGSNALTLEGWLSSKDEAISEAAIAWNRRPAPAQGALTDAEIDALAAEHSDYEDGIYAFSFARAIEQRVRGRVSDAADAVRLELIKSLQHHIVDIVRSFGDVSCAAYISTYHKPDAILAAIKAHAGDAPENSAAGQRSKNV